MENGYSTSESNVVEGGGEANDEEERIKKELLSNLSANLVSTFSACIFQLSN